MWKGLFLLLCLYLFAVVALPTEMKAVVQVEHLGNLSIGLVPVPSVGPRDVLIEVHHSALNRMDLLQAKGLYPLPPGTSDILGVEVSGYIAAIGDECVLGFRLGEPVMALLLGGGYAEFSVADERTVMRNLPGMSLQQSAAIPEAFMTAYSMLYSTARVRFGESVLMHAAASSIGQAAIQIATKKGVKVFVTTRSQEKLDRCIQLGAVGGVVVGQDGKFAQEIKRLNDGNEVDVILDPVGSTYLEENLQAIAYDGRWVLYGLLSGGKIDDPTFLKKFLFKRVNLLGTTLRARSVDYKQSLISALSQDPEGGLPAIASGDIKVEVSHTFDMSEVTLAHEIMARNENVGKIVLSVGAGESGQKSEL